MAETLGNLGLSEHETIEVPIVITTCSILSVPKSIYRNVPLTIDKTIFPSNLIEFELGDQNIIWAWIG